ncbi:MAG: hypothetical protein KAS32_27890, partial [Candidatus Peribacteraceae bacterium]|nr:hypothetical protein [Candidatus Peribacteraceae bacterium]
MMKQDAWNIYRTRDGINFERLAFSVRSIEKAKLIAGKQAGVDLKWHQTTTKVPLICDPVHGYPIHPQNIPPEYVAIHDGFSYGLTLVNKSAPNIKEDLPTMDSLI